MSRLKEIRLSWFRGAGELAVLETLGKSVVIYGENAAGKSSFVDAIECLISGKCDHLSHEYSGTHQEKGLINTHKPSEAVCKIGLIFEDGTDASAAINATSKPTCSGDAKDVVAGWEYPRVVLRQDEIARFIQSSKGDKYSALLPLLGLGHLEVAAENMRQLAKAISARARLPEKQSQHALALRLRRETFGGDTDEEIARSVTRIYRTYVDGDQVGLAKQVEAALTEITRRQREFGKEERKSAALKRLSESGIVTEVAEVRTSTSALAALAIPLSEERLSVLSASVEFLAGIDAPNVDCPACGRAIETAEFREHIADEIGKLENLQEARDAKERAVGAFCDAVLKMREAWLSPDISDWRLLEENSELSTLAEVLSALNLQALRSDCPEKTVAEIEGLTAKIVEVASAAAFDAPETVQSLHTHARILETAKQLVGVDDLAAEIEGIEGLIAFISAAERQLRDDIKTRSKAIFDGISDDIQSLWDRLNPIHKITDVKLHVPFDADKAIDVSIHFFGVPQPTPRLTLSEGNRNGLGLCIFLALAKRTPGTPIVLDDVVVSMDRNHRGMVAEILEQDFADRQVILLTHDREWYTELGYLLSRSRWEFQMILPWESPEEGIKIAGVSTTFDVARAHLATRPDSAANDARKIMDTQLPIIAERLDTRLPYRRGDKNDRRTGIDFIQQLIGDSSKAFEIKKESGYEKHPVAASILDTARARMIAWGNSGSHTFDTAKAEAEKLIDACEAAISLFVCDDCERGVWRADTGNSEIKQCECGALRWRYGKA